MVVRKMKEKCKDAARMRRDKERAEFVELSKLLPLPSSTTSQLDKASIIRLTSSYLRMRSAFPRGLGGDWGFNRTAAGASSRSIVNGKMSSLAHNRTHHHHQHEYTQSYNTRAIEQQQHQQIRELGSLILQTLDGFVFALHKDGKIMYISETASVHLGLPQIDLTGSSVYEYVHPSDHNDIYEMLNLDEHDKNRLDSVSPIDGADFELGRSFCMRMKCILPKRNAGLVSSGYKAIHCNGYLKARKVALPAASDAATNQAATHQELGVNGDSSGESSSSGALNPGKQRQEGWESYALVAVGHSLLPTASTEVKLSANSFMFRANLDLKLFYIEAPVVDLLGFEQYEMISQSLYQFVHVADTSGLEQSHKTLLSKGQVVTKYYRLMKKDSGFIWVQSYASLVNNPRNMPKPQHIVSICFVLGESSELDNSSIYQPILLAQEQQSETFINNNNNNIVKSDNSSQLLSSLNSQPSPNKVQGKNIKKSVLSSSVTNQLQNSSNNNNNSNSNNKQKKQVQQVGGTKRLRKMNNISSGTKVITHGSNKQNNIISPVASIATSIQPIPIQRVDDSHQHHMDHSQELMSCSQQYQCACTQSAPSMIYFNSMGSMQNETVKLSSSIGSNRRASDDSCSVVSSIASTSVSSSCASTSSISSTNYNIMANQQPCQTTCQTCNPNISRAGFSMSSDYEHQHWTTTPVDDHPHSHHHHISDNHNHNQQHPVWIDQSDKGFVYEHFNDNRFNQPFSITVADPYQSDQLMLNTYSSDSVHYHHQQVPLTNNTYTMTI